ncbi:MAG: flagellar protein FlgN [Burkholderiaceae bacterium]
MTATLPDPSYQLELEVQAARDLLALLEREQAELAAARVDALQELTNEKNLLVARMSTLARTRYVALAAAAHSADENGMRAWLDRGGREAARRQWNELQQLATDARECNRTNGMLIGRHMARNQAALGVLQGATGSASLYGPDGQSTLRSSGHRLVAG